MTGSDWTRAAESAPLHGSVHSIPVHINDKHKVNLPDRLSELPDSVILEIFSYMPIKDVARTSCLSRRWRKLWASYPDLDFTLNEEPTDLLPAFIDKLLLHRGSSTIRKFKLSGFDISYETVNSWVENVVKCNVEELNLNYFCYEDGDKFNYQRPSTTHCIFSCKSLVHLKLEYCKLHLPSNVCLPSLKTLCLKDMELQDNRLKKLLLGCPVIESLKIKKCHIVNDLKISIVNPHLQSLTIVDSREFPIHLTGIEIFAPHLLSLNITKLARKSYHLLDISSLVSVSFLMKSASCVGRDTATTLLGLLEQVTHVEELQLSNWLIMSLADIDTTGYPLCLCAKTLMLELGLHNIEFWGLDYLFRHSKLESLVLDIIPEPKLGTFEFEDEEDEILMDPGFPCFPKDLRTVEINNFGVTYAETRTTEARFSKRPLGSVDEKIFVEVMLDKCSMLETLSITFAESLKNQSSTKSELASWLASVPKSSPIVQVILRN